MTFYDTLGLDRNASADQIKTAHRKLILKHHPDKSNDPSSPRIFLAVQSAWECLSDPLKRAEYDQELNYRPQDEAASNRCYATDYVRRKGSQSGESTKPKPHPHPNRYPSNVPRASNNAQYQQYHPPSNAPRPERSQREPTFSRPPHVRPTSHVFHWSEKKESPLTSSQYSAHQNGYSHHQSGKSVSPLHQNSQSHAKYYNRARDIPETHATHDPRFRQIHAENQYAYPSRNTQTSTPQSDQHAYQTQDRGFDTRHARPRAFRQSHDTSEDDISTVRENAAQHRPRPSKGFDPGFDTWNAYPPRKGQTQEYNEAVDRSYETSIRERHETYINERAERQIRARHGFRDTGFQMFQGSAAHFAETQFLEGAFDDVQSGMRGLGIDDVRRDIMHTFHRLNRR